MQIEIGIVEGKKFGITYESEFVVKEDAVICFVKAYLSKKTGDYMEAMGIGDTSFGFAEKGVARLKQGDKCDVDFAKRIAEKKALRGVYKAWVQAYKGWTQELIKKENALLALMSSAETQANACDKRIEYMVSR